jgi:hypothetical protein
MQSDQPPLRYRSIRVKADAIATITVARMPAAVDVVPRRGSIARSAPNFT